MRFIYFRTSRKSLRAGRVFRIFPGVLAIRDKAPYFFYSQHIGDLAMTVTFELSPEREAALKAQAQARGLTLEVWLMELADQHTAEVSIAHLQRTDPQEWARRFDTWVNSHDPNAPVLSDEAMSRESIYPDRV
jgi:hypothetical protein